MKIFKNGKKIFMTFAGVLSLAVLVFYHAGIILAAVPTVTTGSASSISKSSAVISGTISDDGGVEITEGGFEYGETTNYGLSVLGTISYTNTLSFSKQTISSYPGQIEVDSSGNIYVAMCSVGYVGKYDSNGGFIEELGHLGGVSCGVDNPGVIAIDGNGNKLVAELDGFFFPPYEVDKYDENDDFVGSLSWVPGNSDNNDGGKFYIISGIAIDSSGNIYTSDSMANRIQKFDSDYNFLFAFGWGVDTGANQFEICTTTCRLGSSNSGNGGFSSPRGIAVDESGNIYVSDSGNDRVQKFDSSGSWVANIGTSGSGDGNLDNPYDVAVDSFGNIFIADHDNNRVEKFDSSGSYIESVTGTIAGSNISGLDEYNGKIFVSDTSHNQIKIYSQFITSPVISGLTCGTTYHYRAFATNADGTSYGSDQTFTTLDCELPLIYTKPATDISVNAVYLNALQIDDPSVSTTSRGFEWGITTSYGHTVTYSPVRNAFNTIANEFVNYGADDVSGVYVDSNNKLYVANKTYNSAEIYGDLDGNYPSAVFGWGVETGASQFEICSSGCQTGISGSGDGQFNAPEGIVYNSNADKIYVADTGNNRIQIFDSSGNYLSQFGSSGSGDGQFSSPKGLSTYGNYIYVVDSGNNRVQKFNTSGAFVSKIAGFNSPSFISPNSTGSGYLFVANTGDNTIFRIDQNLSSIIPISFTYSSGVNVLNSPVGIASDSRDNLFITDSEDRILFAAPVVSGEINDYVFLASFGQNGSSSNQFATPKGISEDNTGILPNLIIADSANNRVVKTNPFMQSRQNSVHGINCFTTYHYRAFATNADGTAYGDDMTFTTGACPVTGGPPSGPPPDNDTEGCTDIYASNFDADATTDDGTCQYDDIYGCTDPSADNYDMTATSNDGSCSFGGGGGGSPGCTDPLADNYDATATYDNGSCSSGGGGGEDFCLDPSASNFNQEGSCQYPPLPIAGCTDPAYIGYYNPAATIDNGTCPTTDEPPTDPVTEINQVIGHIFDDPSKQSETYKDVAIIGLIFPAIWSLLVDRTAFFSLAIRLWNLIPTILGLRRKRRPWGTVYDSVTKQPLDPAYVTLFSAEDKNEIQKSITDIDGRYGFWATIGKYFIDVKKSDYVFPSVKLTGREKDELYDNLYFGGEINVEEEDSIINKNIPMDAINFNWNEFEKSKNKKLMKFFSRGELFLARIAKILFIVGFTASFLLVFLEPRIFNYVVLGIYVLITILSFVGIKPRKPGFIFEKNTGYPLSYGILYVFSALLNQEVAHTIVGKTGKYYVLVQKGEYYVKLKKKIGENEYEDIYTSNVFKSKKGYINKIIKI